MNKKTINKKNKIILVGSARGVKRFYIVNELMKLFPSAKVINTGTLIQQLTKKYTSTELDFTTISDYYKLIEPMFMDIIFSHLEHSDVILDTHYYYLLPGISMKEILKFKGNISESILILVKDSIDNIINNNNGDWFKNIQHVGEDLLLNEHSFEVYRSTFENFVATRELVIDINNYNKKELMLLCDVNVE